MCVFEDSRNPLRYFGMNDKIDDVCELMKNRRLDILCVNKTNRKGNGGAIKRETFDSYWSGVDQSQRGCHGVEFILSERLSECLNRLRICESKAFWFQLKLD
ncbi:hypothetical protein EVAR_3237_1 [Eumeta japonica]|uniref:Craniofacial development protein 2 n=1 Tax=Eumeta variegata TaxID=151549 RepID=A0A4C1SXH5_EUMVA|nr:hypothetical protein EVAR_3237_1 [Eumeta japonica]